jgi:hypothetical protein
MRKLKKEEIKNIKKQLGGGVEVFEAPAQMFPIRGRLSLPTLEFLVWTMYVAYGLAR